MTRSRFPLAAALLAVAVSTSTFAAVAAKPADAAAATITNDGFLRHVKRLASDEFEGRAPATRGETLTVDYLTSELKKLGLAPGNPDGTYVQKVPLVAYKIDTSAELKVSNGREDAALKFGDDYVAWTRRLSERESMNGEMVFVGYGAVAPEYGWDDFKGVDVKGKVVVMLINDPPLPDEKLFGGKAMTYYGRWTYKYEIAAQKGAAGCIIVHETVPASYPWEVVRNGRMGEQFTIAAPDENRSLLPVEGWMTVDSAKRVFAMGGTEFEAAKRAALDKNFKPMPMGVTANLALSNAFRRVESNNVVAKLEGSDKKLKDEYVVYTAHWDHFGIGSPVKGDVIYNGAVDNATGTAGILEIARAFASLKQRPKRSILFLAVTAEERGLLGSAYYGASPLYPLVKTVGVVNIDSMNVRGRTTDVTVVGLGNSTLDDDITEEAKALKRTVRPDPHPEAGGFYRSDHFSFAKQGVPALYVGGGVDFVGKQTGFAEREDTRYTTEDYHKPSDEVRPDWDVSGAVDDLRLVFRVGLRVANAGTIPSWREGTEFKAKRDQMLRDAAGRR